MISSRGVDTGDTGMYIRDMDTTTTTTRRQRGNNYHGAKIPVVYHEE
jgi:hypothetical protein